MHTCTNFSSLPVKQPLARALIHNQNGRASQQEKNEKQGEEWEGSNMRLRQVSRFHGLTWCLSHIIRATFEPSYRRRTRKAHVSSVLSLDMLVKTPWAVFQIPSSIVSAAIFRCLLCMHAQPHMSLILEATAKVDEAVFRCTFDREPDSQFHYGAQYLIWFWFSTWCSCSSISVLLLSCALHCIRFRNLGTGRHLRVPC